MRIAAGGQRAKSLEDRLWEKIFPDPESGCWLWTGATGPFGYGRFNVHGVMSQAYRAVYEYYVGFIPEGLQLDHLCRNPNCVNPAHLEPVTPLVNLRRSTLPEVNRARFRAQTHCKRGHEYTPENTAVRPNSTRACKKCMAEANARRYADPKIRAQLMAYGREYQRKRREAKRASV